MAAGGSAVTVLTPNGRRQTIKVSPNTPLLQVLEDVCKKHGFNPDDHGLKFQRAVVDLTLPWRFANLPNNAKLEMVTSSRKQAGAEVRIALQRQDGSRLQGSFSSGQTLWELLTHFPEISGSQLSESGSTPVCVYMRDEVSGEEALKKATLKSLGLTGGSAIVRFLLKKDKTPGEEDVSETAVVLTPPVAMETAPSPLSQPDPAPSFPETSTTEVPNTECSPDVPMETSPPTPVAATSSQPPQREDASNPQHAVPPEAPPTGSGTPVRDEEEAGPSGLNCHPSSSSPSSSAPSAPFIPFSGGGQRLGGPVGGGGAGGGRGGGGEAGARSVPSSSSSAHSALTSVVESPKAKKVKSNPSSKCKAAASEDLDLEDQFLEPVERDPLIYHLDSMSRQSEDDRELPDEFFEVTVDDIRRRFAQLKSERRLLEEAPLMTKSLREGQMKEKMARYPKVVLRVQFPDRHVLQGFFRPLETVGGVMEFVRSHLEDPQLSFYLFITPPKTILEEPSATLFQADLFPGAIVYFGSNAKTDFYIKKELLQSSVSASRANHSIASCMLRSPTSSCSSAEEPPPPEEPTEGSTGGPAQGGSTQAETDPSVEARAPKPARSDPGKVPKWLKLPVPKTTEGLQFFMGTN